MRSNRTLSWRPAECEGARHARQIGARRPVRDQPGGTPQRDNLGLLVPADFEDQCRAGRKQRRGLTENQPLGVERVLDAVEGAVLIVLAHLGGERRDVVAANVGRVGDDEIVRAGQRGGEIAHREGRAGL